MGATEATNEHELLTSSQAATLLGVSATTLFDWRRREEGPPYLRVGPKLIKYRRADVLAWLRSRERAGA